LKISKKSDNLNESKSVFDMSVTANDLGYDNTYVNNIANQLANRFNR